MGLYSIKPIFLVCPLLHFQETYKFATTLKRYRIFLRDLLSSFFWLLLFALCIVLFQRILGLLVLYIVFGIFAAILIYNYALEIIFTTWIIVPLSCFYIWFFVHLCQFFLRFCIYISLIFLIAYETKRIFKQNIPIVQLFHNYQRIIN